MQSQRRVVILLVGPTAVGKTELSLRIARVLKGEIVSADSRQLYKHMDIGTAKPSLEQQSLVRHHCIDLLAPDEYYSAGEYGRHSRKVIDVLLNQGKVPIVVGGSGLYIRALVDGFFDPHVYNGEIRRKLRERLEALGPEGLHGQLKSVDHEAAGRIHPNDGQRIIRALEVYEITKRPLSDLQKESMEKKADFTPLFIGLNRSREELHRRIDRRVDEMIERGLIDEVKRLSEMGFDRSLNSMQTVGYQEVFSFLDGEIDLEEAIHLLKKNSRRYAKRQLTWFKRDSRVRWFALSEGEDLTPIMNRIMELYLEEKRGNRC
jgi:tRNA dimethylallyltransferase